MDVGPPVGPVVDNVVIVRNLDGLEIDRAELLHLRDQEIREALPAPAASIGWTALRLEHVPFPRLLGRDHAPRVDPGYRGLHRALRQRWLLRQHDAGGDAGRASEEISARRTPPRLARAPHRFPPFSGLYPLPPLGATAAPDKVTANAPTMRTCSVVLATVAAIRVRKGTARAAYAASTSRNRFHTAVAAPDSSTRT